MIEKKIIGKKTNTCKREIHKSLDDLSRRENDFCVTLQIVRSIKICEREKEK
jgi:hypothetical protein